MRTTKGAIALGLLFCCGMAWAGPKIEVADRFPVQGKSMAVRILNKELSSLGCTVKATYRPNSKVSLEEEVGTTDLQGIVHWTPREAGVAQLTASCVRGSATRLVSVKFKSLPLSGLAVFLIAGTVLFGGVVLGFRKLLKESPPKE